jgi:hypothetical protein
MGDLHLLHPMRSTRVPRRYVFFDTEAHRRRIGGVETQTWRLAVSSTVVWQSKEQRWSRPVVERHETPEDLWATICDRARPSTRTVVVAHNLGYDLRISRALEILPASGWTVDKLVISPEHCGMDLVRNDLRLVLVDSSSVLPVSLRKLGELLLSPKGDLPPEEAPDEVLYPYCERDVEILQRAYLTVVEALRAGDLGCWARTGSGIGWNTLLRRFLDAKVLVHGDDKLRSLEHGAAGAGRCEAWRWGRLGRGPWTEWDHELAYAHVLATETLPAYLQDHVSGAKLSTIERSYPRNRWLVHARVATEAPVLSLKLPEGHCWPVGTFEGWWWDCELLQAAAEGAQIAILEAWRYKGEAWLAEWASWVIDLCLAPMHGPEAVLAVAAKHWQRAVVGRSAMRWRDWTEQGDAWTTDVAYMPLLDLDTGAVGSAFSLGGRRWEAWERIWHDSALPQLHSAVMAHCRVRLWAEMRIAGLESLAYVDTDALITDPAGSRRLEDALAAGQMGSLRRKSDLAGLTVHAPKYLTATGMSRIAGVPRNRRRTGQHRYSAETWESLAGSLASGHTGSVVIQTQRMEVSTMDWRRVHLAGGATAPYEVLDGIRVTTQEATG